MGKGSQGRHPPRSASAPPEFSTARRLISCRYRNDYIFLFLAVNDTSCSYRQDLNGQVSKTKSVSAGLDYPAVGPEHAFLKDSGRAVYLPVTDKQALDAFFLVSKTEGIIPALEPSHALHQVFLCEKMYFSYAE